MKKILAIISSVVAYSMLNAAQTIYFVDMAKVYENFYKAKEAAAQINASAETTRQELQKMDQKRQELIKEVRAFDEKLKNPALTQEAKNKIIETEAQPKYAELQRMESDMRNVSDQAKTRLRENAQKIQQVHFREISAVIEKLAKEKKADFVLAKNVCLFSDAKYDLSDEVLKIINANAPAAKK